MAARDLRLILGQRLWQGAAGLVTVLFVARFLTAEEQGWYYTFVSVAALYSVFDMGLSAAVTQTAAHMFSSLRWRPHGDVEGPAAGRFTALLSRAARVYLLFALAFAAIVAAAGIACFGAKADEGAATMFWSGPWLTLVFATAANMLSLPLLSAVEGSGRISEVYGVRLLQGVAGSATCWAIIAGGGSLWAPAAIPGMALVVAILWLVVRRPRMLRAALARPSAGDFDWRREIWPLQWRIGVSWIAVYLMSQLATPILFYYQDAVVAGQMGLSLTIAHMAGLLSQSALARTVAPMSQAVAHRRWDEFAAVFSKGLRQFLAIFALGAVGIGIAYAAVMQTPYANRVLPPEQLSLLLGFTFFYQLNAAFAAHLRAFRREPLAWISALGAVLVIVGSIAVAPIASALGVALVMLAVQGCIVFPLSFLTWRQCVAKWCSD